MGLITIIFIALGLAMDAFAVSISCGISNQKNTMKNAIKVGTAFGGFQMGMTILGWILGLSFREIIEPIDHWIAFILLAIIGVQMIKEGVDTETECTVLTGLKVLLTLAVATSIDALAAGISFSTLNIDVFFPSVAIGLITYTFSFCGVFVGDFLGCNTGLKKYIDILGGVILLLMGTKVLLDHLFFGG